MKRLLQEIADFFAIGFNEARGVLALLSLTGTFLILPLLYRTLWPDSVHDTTADDQRKLDSLVALMQVDSAADARQYRQANGYAPRRPDDAHGSEHYREVKPFPFDPNTVSVAGWQQLGLPRWLAERIDKYRSKGGRFRKKEDLLRIYDFPPESYEQLEPYIQLPAASNAVAGGSNVPDESSPASGNVPASMANVPSRPANVRPEKPPLQPFDINTADTSQLIALKGIGSTLARRIITYRNDLGGFLSSAQYTEIFGLDSISLAQLRTYAQVRSGVRKTPINTASAADLDRFPFLSRRQAEVIVNYRTQHGAYASPESLRAVRVLDARTIEKLTPYLSF
jgi:competence protein ComEA